MDLDEQKRRLRTELLAARRSRPPRELEAARAAVRDQLLPRCAGCRTVAAYVPLAAEPGSVELLSRLAEAGTEVLVPIMLPDRDLDWAPWSAAGTGERQGLGAIGRAELVVVPALAVAADGTRLGRGGGSYDRALARVRAGTPIVALLFADEFVTRLPRAEWDLPVTAVITPERWVDVSRNTGTMPDG